MGAAQPHRTFVGCASPALSAAEGAHRNNGPKGNAMAISSEEFRNVLRFFPAGVTIVAVRAGE
ncbi:MAG: hypothetical protein ACLF0P_13375, partial [Thermoanaerobaculia bacterium]